MQLSLQENRIIITQDKDFGELTFRSQPNKCAGVILFRLSGSNPDDDINLIIQTIQSRQDWQDHFTVVTNKQIRIRRF